MDAMRCGLCWAGEIFFFACALALAVVTPEGTYVTTPLPLNSARGRRGHACMHKSEMAVVFLVDGASIL
jgi:hypothetical protein